MTKLTRYEQETIINYNAEEQTAAVYTSLLKARIQMLRCKKKRNDKKYPLF